MSVPRPLAPSPVEVPAKRHGRLGSGVGPRLFLLAGAGLAWLIPALWNPAASSIPGDGGTVTVTHFGGATRGFRFYRIRQLP